MNFRLLPVSHEHCPWILEQALKSENGEFFRRHPKPETWPKDTSGWWNTSYLVQLLDSEETVGIASLSSIDYVSRQAEFGLLLTLPKEGRRKQSTEIIKFVLQFIFECMNLEKAYCRILEHRHSLVGEFIAHGFHFDGKLRKNVLMNGQLHDELVFSLLKEEWNQWPSR